ncbi:MAG: hypothetical protein DLM57_03625 [Pseudonocardiales bacterium]|nr:MAG: hypothetical protein DLM57_03625 [Pseudonocardiales bacterium]
MSGQRDVIDYGLQRRALLGDVAAGRRTQAEACDAHPHLLLAAKHYGTPGPVACPVCARHRQQHVHYVFGAALGKTSGQAKSPAELSQLAATHTEFDVYVVEVCPDCGWNHLIRSFVLGRPADSALTAADG